MTKIISLKVSPLSKKILLREYPAHEPSGTIVAGSHTLLYRQVVARLPLRRQKTDVLTADISVAITTHTDIADHDLLMVGLMIHQEHRMACMRWIQATVAAGQTASHGIRTFFDHYDLLDEDLNYESVFRQWQRYVRHNVDLLQKPREKILDKKVIRKRPAVMDEDRFAHFCADIVEYLYRANHKWNHTLVRDLRFTILAEDNFVSQINDSSAWRAQTVYSGISRTRRWIDKHHKVRAAYLKYFGPDAASSQHDHQGHRVDKIPMRT